MIVSAHGSSPAKSPPIAQQRIDLCRDVTFAALGRKPQKITGGRIKRVTQHVVVAVPVLRIQRGLLGSFVVQFMSVTVGSSRQQAVGAFSPGSDGRPDPAIV